jgi:hypothetical protein
MEIDERAQRVEIEIALVRDVVIGVVGFVLEVVVPAAQVQTRQHLHLRLDRRARRPDAAAHGHLRLGRAGDPSTRGHQRRKSHCSFHGFPPVDANRKLYAFGSASKRGAPPRGSQSAIPRALRASHADIMTAATITAAPAHTCQRGTSEKKT